MCSTVCMCNGTRMCHCLICARMFVGMGCVHSEWGQYKKVMRNFQRTAPVQQRIGWQTNWLRKDQPFSSRVSSWTIWCTLWSRSSSTVTHWTWQTSTLNSSRMHHSSENSHLGGSERNGIHLLSDGEVQGVVGHILRWKAMPVNV